MLTVTPPLAVDGEHIWVLVEADTGIVDAARLARFLGSGTFIALPVEVFNTEGLFPTYRSNGEPVLGFRWANAEDVELYADMFAERPGGDL